MSVRLRTKWLWVRILLLSLKLQILRLFQGRVSWYSRSFRVQINSKHVFDIIKTLTQGKGYSWIDHVVWPQEFLQLDRNFVSHTKTANNLYYYRQIMIFLWLPSLNKIFKKLCVLHFRLFCCTVVVQLYKKKTLR